MSEKLSPGKMRWKVSFGRPVTTTNDYGEEIQVFEPLSVNPDVWAEKQDYTGKEAFEAAQETASASTVWNVKWRNDLNREMQLTCEGVIYDILSIAEIGRRVGLKITTRQKEQ